MEENKIWANLNDSYNLDIILIENQNLKDYIPKKDICKQDFKKVETIVNVEEIVNEIILNDFTSNNVLEILSKQKSHYSYAVLFFERIWL